MQFESLWSPDILQLVETPIPAELTGKQRTAYYKAKKQAVALLRDLFPPDED